MDIVGKNTSCLFIIFLMLINIAVTIDKYTTDKPLIYLNNNLFKIYYIA